MGPRNIFNRGQYTYKIYRIADKVPGYLRTLQSPFISKTDYKLHEESWNAYPYCRTVITNPTYMKESFKVVLETLCAPDRGGQTNPLAKAVRVPGEVVDITEPKSKELREEL